jgi:hypothetical protein
MPNALLGNPDRSKTAAYTTTQNFVVFLPNDMVVQREMAMLLVVVL